MSSAKTIGLSRRQSLRRLALASLSLSGRSFGAGMSGAVLTSVTAGCASGVGNAPKIVIVGGGFAGASCARAVKTQRPSWSVTLIEPQSTYTACPMSNLVVADSRPIASQQFNYDSIARIGVQVVNAAAQDVDPVKRTVTLADETVVPYERLVLAPGIEMNWQALPGYDESAAELMPHAWKAGAQTLLLKRQLQAMPNGGLVVIAPPENPYRCPPGPYERAGLIANFLQQHKPRAKVLILDSKDRFSKQALFQQAWRELYGVRIEWQGLSDGARVTQVDAQRMTVHTDFDSVKADVINVIPPQRAGFIARRAGVADASGWCPIVPLTFASTLQSNIHVIGDAAIANAMPKSAFSANAQANLCALQIVRQMEDDDAVDTPLINTCYSLAQPDYGFSVAGVYRASQDAWVSVPGAGGSSALSVNAGTRKAEANHARAWFTKLTQDVFRA